MSRAHFNLGEGEKNIFRGFISLVYGNSSDKRSGDLKMSTCTLTGPRQHSSLMSSASSEQVERNTRKAKKNQR